MNENLPVDYTQQISQFVEGIRLISQVNNKTPQQDIRNVRQRLSSDYKEAGDNLGDNRTQEVEENLEDRQVRDWLLREAKERANEIVLEAEQV